MDILDTVEVRWFLEDGHPTVAAARTWLEGVTPEDERVDRYLLTGRDDLGIKIRSGARPTLETKYRLGIPHTTVFGPNVVGRFERWRKLSLETDDGTLQKDGTWLPIAKERTVRTLSFPEGACSVELARIDAGTPETTAWTFALEASGAAELRTTLETACRQVFRGAGGFALGGSYSMSYPAWLLATIVR